MWFLNRPLSIADRVDSVFLYIFVLSAIFLVGITVVMVYFTLKYSRKRNVTPVDIEGNPWLEATWTLIPLVLFLSMFYFGWTDFSYMRNPPRDAMVIEVTARQWAWSFKYPNGKRSDELYVALNRPVKVELRSQDVLHGFAIAAFRIKEDVVPGKANYTWFLPTLLGTFDIQCTVMCGVHHTYMLSKVHVLPEDEFRAWYFADENAPGPAKLQPAAAPAAEDGGLAILREKHCLLCHSLDGAQTVGVSFKGLYGQQRAQNVDGKATAGVVDDAYLVRAIRDPGRHVADGYPASMPPIPLSEDEIARVAAYIKTLR